MRTYDLEDMVDAESGNYEQSRHYLVKQLIESSVFVENQKEEPRYIWEENKPNVLVSSRRMSVRRVTVSSRSPTFRQ